MREKPSSFPHALDVVVMNQLETTIWHGLPPRDAGAPQTEPQVVSAPDRNREHRHVRTAQGQHMHHRDPNDPKYMEAVADAVCDAERILLVGHGHGRSSTSRAFLTHVQSRRPEIAKRVIGEIGSDLSALDRAEIVELARRWYATYIART